MRVHPVPTERTPLFLHLTYSLCLHAAAVSLLISVPVFGGSGTPPGGEYVVTLTSPADQPGHGDTFEKTPRQPAGKPGEDKPAGIGPGKKDSGTGEAKDAGKNDVAEDIQLPDVTDAAGMQTGVNPVADKTKPVPIPSNIPVPSTRVPELTATAKPFFAEVPSEPLPVSKAGAAVKADTLHQAKTEPPVPTKISGAVKPAPSAAPPIQEEPFAKPDVPEVRPDPQPESGAVTPMFIPAKPVIAGPDNMLPRGDTIPPVADRKIAPSKTTAKTREKGDVSSSPAAISTPPETQSKAPVGESHPAGKPAGTASAKKSSQASSKVSALAGLTSGSGTSSKKGKIGGRSDNNSGTPGSGGDGDVGTGNIAGATGAGNGSKFSTPSLSRGLGLLRGIGNAFGEPTLAGREGTSGKDVLAERGKKGSEEAPPVAIRVPEALLVRDIKIEVIGEKKGLSDISMGLTIRAHPAKRKKHAEDPEKSVEGAEITTGTGDAGASRTKTLSLKEAEKGVYIFSLTNAVEAFSAAIVFRFYERSQRERIKEYKSFPLTPATVAKFKFLMPEALFWDDTDRFSGSIEDSHSVTKFDYKSGLLWKEEKE